MLRLLFGWLLIISLACSKPAAVDGNTANATIIGFSAEKCACCWGYKIQLDDPVVIPAMYPARDYYLAESFPNGFEVSPNAQFPIRVKIDCEFDNSKCHYTYLRIKSISIPISN